MSDTNQPGFNPYGYEYTPPTSPTRTGQPTGKQIVAASWQLLRQDRELIWLPVVGTLAGLVAGAILFVPGFAIGHAAANNDKVGAYVGGALAAFAISVVAIYFQAALVIGAYQRADGGQPSFGGVLRGAWALKRQIIAWAVLATTVGLAVRAIEQRLGILGKIIGFLGGVAWAIASFFAIPVVVAEGLGPIEALKRSAAVIRTTWGTSVRTTLRVAFTWLLPMFGAIIVLAIGIAAATDGNLALGLTFILLGAAGLVGASAAITSVTTYARALIYRHATGRPVPGIAPELFAGAFRSKGARRR